MHSSRDADLVRCAGSTHSLAGWLPAFPTCGTVLPLVLLSDHRANFWLPGSVQCTSSTSGNRHIWVPACYAVLVSYYDGVIGLRTENRWPTAKSTTARPRRKATSQNGSAPSRPAVRTAHAEKQRLCELLGALTYWIVVYREEADRSRQKNRMSTRTAVLPQDSADLRAGQALHGSKNACPRPQR